MELEVLGVGEYEGVIIMLKKGSSLSEIPINYQSEKRTLEFGLMSSINSKCLISGGLSGQIGKMFGKDRISQELLKQHRRQGDVVPYTTNSQFLKKIYFLVLDSSSQNVGDFEKDLLKNTIKKALNEMENDKLDSAVIPGISCQNNRYPINIAADLHFEAIEEFIEETMPRNLNLISICLYDQDEVDAFLVSAHVKLKKYSFHSILVPRKT